MAAVETPVPANENAGLKDEEMAKAKEVAKEVVAEAAEAINLLAQGKRNMLCGEMPEAVTQLQEACRLLAKKYGETADECGEAYLAYGTALLDLSRMESGVLGNALEGAHIDSADDSSDEKEEKATTEDEESDKMTDSDDTEGTVESEDIADEGEGEEEEGEEGEDGDTENAGEGTSDGKEAKDDSEEDVTNLQLAWEVLELSKLIYNRQESKEMKLKAAEAHLKLGEVGMETEQYDQALEDLQACLKIQQEHLEPESRLIAESHYQIGLACVFSTKYNLALENLRKAVSVINAKMSKLHSFIEEEEKKEKRDGFSVINAQKEIKDLKEILPDILAKIEDTEDERNNQDKVKQMVKENVAKAGSSEKESDIKFSEASSIDKSKEKQDSTVSDIGHLVRKKRKPEEEPEATEDSKKAKADTNGQDATPPVVNGSGDAKVSS